MGRWGALPLAEDLDAVATCSSYEISVPADCNQCPGGILAMGVACHPRLPLLQMRD